MKRLLILFLIAACLLSVAALAEEPQPEPAQTAIEALFAEEYPDAVLMDARWMISDPHAIVALFATDEHIGVIICEQQGDQPFAVTARNDQLFILQEEADCLFDGEPDADPILRYTAPSETYSLTLAKETSGDWYVRHMVFNRSEHDIQYTLSDDARFIIVADLTYPRVWWPIEAHISLTRFDIAAVCDVCDRAVAYMYDEELQLESLYAYQIEWQEP